MLIRNKKSWQIKEGEITPISIFAKRPKAERPKADISVQTQLHTPTLNRRLMLGLGGASFANLMFGNFGLKGGLINPAFAASSLPNGYFPAKKNEFFQVPERSLTDKDDALSYNNFYEFGSHKQIASLAQKMKTDPWSVEIDGLVEKPMILGLEDIYRLFPPEERIYRFRCVEAWAMTVPWSGFTIAALMKHVAPLAGAKFVQFETKMDAESMPGLKAVWYPWPYTEAITIEEAGNDLAFLATGLYGEALRPQNGAPIRLVLPWKYGFKSIKSIVKISFVEKRTPSFWENLQDKEYGFWANVNPEVSHPRWSQATERLLSSGDRVPTKLYNGYEEQVSGLYKDIIPKLGDIIFR